MAVRYQNLNEEERVEYWLNMISYSKKVMKPWFDACSVLESQYNGDASSERELDLEDVIGEQHTSRLQSNIIYGWIDQSISNMLDREPTIRAKATNVIGVDFQETVSQVQDYYYRRTNQLRTDERVTLDAFLMPYGVAKIGYTVDFDARMQDFLQPDAELEFESPADEELFLQNGTPTLITEGQDHRFHIESHTAMLQDPTLSPDLAAFLEAHIEIHKAFVDRVRPDPNTSILYEAPFGIRWRPDKFHIDWNAQEGLADARWIAFEWEMPVEEVRANPAYKNTGALEASGRTEGAPDRLERLDEDPFDTVRGYEIWVKAFPQSRGKFVPLLLTIAEGHKKFLREDDSWPYDNLDDYPAEMVSFQSSVRTWFNKPPLLQAGGTSVQSMINEIMDSYLYVARKQKNIWLYDPAFIDSSTLQGILDAPDSSTFPVKGLADRDHSGRIVQPLPFTAVGNEKGELLQLAQQMFDRGAGTPQPVQLPGTDTATEASILDRRNTARENRRATILSEYQLRKATKFWQLVTQFRPANLELIDEKAQEVIELTEDLVKGRYNFTLDISSQSSAIAVERSQWMDLLNLFAGLTPLMVEQYGVGPNLPEIARRLLARGFDEKAAEELLPMLKQQPLPEQVPGAPPQGPAGPVDPNAVPADSPLRDAVSSGRQVGEQDGALNRDTFNRSVATDGQLQGAAQQL